MASIWVFSYWLLKNVKVKSWVGVNVKVRVRIHEVAYNHACNTVFSQITVI